MSRPTRAELLLKFFPELADGKGTSGDREGAIRFNTLAAEAILADQIRLFDQGYGRLGPGVLINRLYNGAPESAYVPLEDFGADHAIAERQGDSATAEFLGDVIDQIEGFNPNKGVLVMLLDNSSAQLFALDRDHPARSIAAMMNLVP